MEKEQIEQLAEKLYQNLQGFETRTLQRIGARLKRAGTSINTYDINALENLIKIGLPLDEIYKDLAEVSEMNVAEVQKIIESVMEDEVLQTKSLHQKTGIPFLPYKDDDFAKSIVSNWAEITAGEMINLSKTKSIGFTDINGNFKTIEGAYKSAIDKAVASVRAGAVDSNTAIRDLIKELGGSGIKTNYASGRSVRLDSMARSWVLYGVKQSEQAYDDYISDKLGCDGFEVDYHPHPRPPHEFMGGQVFSYKGDKVVDGRLYPDGKEALKALKDYGCLHFKRGIILGVSEPKYSKSALLNKQKEDNKLIEYNGVKRTKYEWQQRQRLLERMYRENANTATLAKASGEQDIVDEMRKANKEIRKEYMKLSESVGLIAKTERFSYV